MTHIVSGICRSRTSILSRLWTYPAAYYLWRLQLSRLGMRNTSRRATAGSPPSRPASLSCDFSADVQRQRHNLICPLCPPWRGLWCIWDACPRPTVSFFLLRAQRLERRWRGQRERREKGEIDLWRHEWLAGVCVCVCGFLFETERNRWIV